jgi:dihydroorotate dehydrogenase (fumarate)
VASTLFINGLPYLAKMLVDLENWMDDKGYDTLAEFRGKVSQQNVDDPFGFERAQYMKLLMAQE